MKVSKERAVAARLLALAAVMRAMKQTKRAGRRCRKRRKRAIVKMLETPLPIQATGEPSPEEAIAFLRQSCRLCGSCKGV